MAPSNNNMKSSKRNAKMKLSKCNTRNETSKCNRKAIYHAVGFVSRKRPFSTEAQIGLSYAAEKGLFLRLNVFRLRIPTGGSSRKTRFFRLDSPVEKLSRTSVTRVFWTDRIAHPTINHTPTRPHGHTPISGTTMQYHKRRWRWLGYPCCCFSQQVSVAHS